jgi:hypothetical protein
MLALPFGILASAAPVLAATTKVTAEAQTQAIVSATTAFLNSLSAEQRAKVQFPFTPAMQGRRFNLKV